MLSLFGVDEAVRNLYRLARLQLGDGTINNAEDVREQYLAFLAARQPHAPVNWGDDVFVDDEMTEERLSKAFSDGVLNDMGQADVFGSPYKGKVRERKVRIAGESLTQILGRDDDFALIFCMVIHSIFVRSSKPTAGSRGSHGGSSSAAIGTIWLTVEDSLKPIDLMEMFVHELTHHLLFVDELNHAQFEYSEISKPENFARSAILKRNRPLDKVVHSMVVPERCVGGRIPPVSQASDFVNSVDGRIPNLDSLKEKGAQEHIAATWVFQDGSQVRTQWVTSYNALSTYQVEVVGSGE